MRIVQRVVGWVLGLLAWLLLIAIAGGSLAAYLTASGGDLRLLKAAATGLGRLIDGQRTEAITIDATVVPEEHRLDARARLKIAAVGEPRRRFYFLLNDGLHVRRARVVGSPAPPAVYQLWLITVVELPHPLAADETAELELDYDGQPSAGGFGIGGALLDARDVLLSVDHFWYPSDVHSFFEADVSVTLPARLTVVHNGREVERAQRGTLQRVRWQSERPIGGMALIAGPYRRTAATIDEQRLQLFVADDVALDSDHVLRDMAAANRFLSARLGPSGFPQLTAFVTRRIRRAFNDGAGAMGLSIRYFRRGEYGFSTIAHEIAHNWWGATVAERWLTPYTGGEWIVEGLAEFSSLRAVEDRWGREALTAGLLGEAFDPARQAAVADMSVIDNALAGATARDTIYRKGAYAALMLSAVVGEEPMQQALRQFVERFRYRQATDRDFEAVVTEVTGQNVSQFFADWLRSTRTADLALEPSGADQVDVRNRGAAIVPSLVDLWVFPGHGAAVEHRTAKVGETVALPSGAELAILDPQLGWADMLRFNNRAPRRPAPQAVAVSSRGDILITSGEPQPWAPVTLMHRTADGKPVRSWEFDRGLTQPPVWSLDGGRILASASEATGNWPAIVVLNAVDGGRTTIGYGASPAFAGNGGIVAAHGDGLLRFESNGPRTLVRHLGANVETPMPSPAGRWIAYGVTRGNAFELRVCDGNGRNDRALLAWDRDRFLARWAPDESRLYAVIGGDWDWQVWEIPLDHSGVRILIREAADIHDLALSPDGQRLAISAAPSVTHPPVAHQLFVVDLQSGRARALDTPSGAASLDFRQLVWETPDTLLAVGAPTEPPLLLPESRTLRRVHLDDGGSEEIPVS